MVVLELKARAQGQAHLDPDRKCLMTTDPTPQPQKACKCHSVARLATGHLLTTH